MKSVYPLFLSVLLSSQFFTGSSSAQVEQDPKPPELPVAKTVVQRLTFAEIETRAKSEDPEAQFQLARRYFDGWGVAKDLTEAAKWFQKAADQGHTRAQTHLGNQYLEGKGVPKSRSLALLLLRKAADKGDGEAQFKVGQDLQYWAPKKDKAAGVEWYMKAASNGNFQALKSLADIYEKGEEVPKDEAKAAAFLTKAQARFQQFFDELVSEGEAGNPESMWQAVIIYLNPYQIGDAKTAMGKLPGSTEYRRAEGIKWMLRAAETSGNPSLLVELGGLYLEGVGMPKDLDRGNELIREGIAKLKGSASKGNAEAAAYLGNAYHYGQLVPKSLQEGEKWWRVAADLGHGASAGMLIYGAKNPPPSKDLRDQWRRLEAESGSAADQYGRGQMFYRGDFETTIDHVEALRWFRRAAEREEIGSGAAQDDWSQRCHRNHCAG
jgi:TPR repeat protein